MGIISYFCALFCGKWQAPYPGYIISIVQMVKYVTQFAVTLDLTSRPIQIHSFSPLFHLQLWTVGTWMQ